MSGQIHTMDCQVVFEPSQPDRFYMDMKVYRLVKNGNFRLHDEPLNEVWRGIYLAVEVKPWMDTGRQLRAS
jgi:hypothetical protein